MNRAILIIGLLVIVGMCLVPPWDTEHYDAGAHAFDRVIRFEGTAPLTRADHTERVVVYRPVWAESQWERGGLGVDQYSGTIHASRLLLQVVVVALVFGVVAYLVPSEQPDDAGDAS